MRFFTRRLRRLPVASRHSEKTVDSGTTEDAETATIPPTPLPPANLEIKRVDYYWSSWSKRWKYKNTGSGVVADDAVRPGGNASSDNDPWVDFCFVAVRKLPADSRNPGSKITLEVVIKSPYLLTACKDVIGNMPGLTWTVEPLRLKIYLFMMFFPQFEEYEKALCVKARTPEEDHVFSSVTVFLDCLRKDCRATLAQIANLKAHGEISFDLLYTIFAPRTVVIAECPVTGATRALKVLNVTKSDKGFGWYDLLCESVDSMEDAYPGRRANTARDPLQSRAVQGDTNVGPYLRRRSSAARMKGVTYDWAALVPHAPSLPISIYEFKGTRTITSLQIYPIEYHSDPQGMKTMLLERGRNDQLRRLCGLHSTLLEGRGQSAITVLSSLMEYYPPVNTPHTGNVPQHYLRLGEWEAHSGARVSIVKAYPRRKDLPWPRPRVSSHRLKQTKRVLSEASEQHNKARDEENTYHKDAESRSAKTVEHLQGQVAALKVRRHNDRRQLKRARETAERTRQKLQLAEEERDRALRSEAAAKQRELDTQEDAELLLGRADGTRLKLLARLRESARQLRALEKRCKRFPLVLAAHIQRARNSPTLFRLKTKGVYTPGARALARGLILSGCSQKKVGHVIEMVGNTLGITVKGKMSAHTVRRAVVEGGVASDIQLGYEITQASSKCV
ncbi:hypothetical protein LXA43DRAFT_1060418 [Ganoderma leucocontextum]|nr:hypothetical protein LXA43DRAFT_1060418 [Ganoderma leucocontextum]